MKDSIRSSRDFQNVYSSGKSYANRYLVMYVLKNELGNCRLGISVSKKVGNSVVRHRLSRLIRESFRLNKSMFNSGLDIIVIARAGAKDRSFKEIEDAFIHLLKLHRVVD